MRQKRKGVALSPGLAEFAEEWRNLTELQKDDYQVVGHRRLAEIQ